MRYIIYWKTLAGNYKWKAFTSEAEVYSFVKRNIKGWSEYKVKTGE